MTMDLFFTIEFIHWMQTFSSELLSLVNLIILGLFLLFAFNRFSLSGLYAYGIVVVLLANIQVLRGSYFFTLSNAPVALGTIPFAMVFLCSDIITEHYGKKAAHKSIGLGLFFQIFFTLSMILALGFPQTPEHLEMHAGYLNMQGLFLPAPRLLLASLISFCVCQWFDITLFSKMKLLTSGKHLWLRTFISGSLSSFADNCLFSTLAWVVFSPTPVSFHDLFYTYILGTYISRLVVSFISYPILNLSYYFKSKTLQPMEA